MAIYLISIKIALAATESRWELLQHSYTNMLSTITFCVRVRELSEVLRAELLHLAKGEIVATVDMYALVNAG